jgi:hypothetical protein
MFRRATGAIAGCFMPSTVDLAPFVPCSQLHSATTWISGASRCVPNETADGGLTGVTCRTSEVVHCSMTVPPARRPAPVRFAAGHSDGRLTAGLPRSNAIVAASSRISVAHRCHPRKAGTPPQMHHRSGLSPSES